MKRKLILLLLSLCMSFSCTLTACGTTLEQSDKDTTIQTDVDTTDTVLETIGSAIDENTETDDATTEAIPTKTSTPYDLGFNTANIEPYQGEPYIQINNNIPFFTEEDLKTEEFITFMGMDELERPRTVYGCLSQTTMPGENEERGEIGQVKPAGWHTVKYPDVITDLYLYNRCHLIGWQLCGENANPDNLITGTRYLNVTGMLPFENQVADYLRKDAENKILYRVTPVYTNDNLIADGVLIEAISLKQNETRDVPELQFCIYCYNVQPGIYIDYKTGDSYENDEIDQTNASLETTEQNTAENYILNTNSMKIHTPDCSAADSISPENKQESSDSIENLLERGYTPCKICNPDKS